MTILELYEKLCTGEIRLTYGLCYQIGLISYTLSHEFEDILIDHTKTNIDGYLSKSGVMTPERETFLLLFAAYRGEL